ncbi:MAG: hypothetical protein JO010_06430 [Alphaproteobacteria bacterium]|nr:hypothetical protein [Alphaproteobacteria bacterium]
MAVEKLGHIELQRRYLCITHSDRPASLDKCDLNYLELRYSRPGRLPPQEPFEALKPSKTYSPYAGEITLHDLGEDGRGAPRLVAKMRPEGYKPQHAAWHGGRLWVVGVEHVEVYDGALRSIAKIEDPWLAGGHTIAPDGRGHMLVSCSASDSVIRIEENGFRVVDALRMPEALYGRNYALARDDSVVEHYITNDQQTTHVNCAWPWRGGILVSALIPGAIGWFDERRSFTELLGGFVGCHGARGTQGGQIYFSDSCVGTLMLLDENLRVRRRIGTGSRWLHDAIEVAGDLFALAVYDREEVWLMDTASREVVHVIDCRGLGGPQFLAY